MYNLRCRSVGKTTLKEVVDCAWDAWRSSNCERQRHYKSIALTLPRGKAVLQRTQRSISAWMALQSLADSALGEYPRSLRDTDLFINALNQSGIADNQQVRSQALARGACGQSPLLVCGAGSANAGAIAVFGMEVNMFLRTT